MDQRLKGQEVSVRVVVGGVVQQAVDAIGSFNDSVNVERKEDAFLGEYANRFDDIFNGYTGGLEFQVSKAAWNDLVTAIRDRATRKTPDLEFNIVRTDLYPNGDSIVYTYVDVKWGPIPTTVGSRGDYVKASLDFGCSERTEQVNNLI